MNGRDAEMVTFMRTKPSDKESAPRGEPEGRPSRLPSRAVLFPCKLQLGPALQRALISLALSGRSLQARRWERKPADGWQSLARPYGRLGVTPRTGPLFCFCFVLFEKQE